MSCGCTPPVQTFPEVPSTEPGDPDAGQIPDCQIRADLGDPCVPVFVGPGPGDMLPDTCEVLAGFGLQGAGCPVPPPPCAVAGPFGNIDLTSGSTRTVGFRLEDADPIIQAHAVHWLVCIETYESDPLLFIANDTYKLIYSDTETHIYQYVPTGCKAIVGFRGTAAFKDLLDDTLLSAGLMFPRVASAQTVVKALLSDNPDMTVELTGHSLGGAIAREVSRASGSLNWKAVTFNAAAPPSYPVESPAGEVDYHIVFDLVSAWQRPNTVRIDKDYWPIPPAYLYGNIMGSYDSFTELVLSHELRNFSNQVPGVVVSRNFENNRLEMWWISLPMGLRLTLLFLLHVVGANVFKLPQLPE